MAREKSFGVKEKVKKNLRICIRFEQRVIRSGFHTPPQTCSRPLLRRGSS
jgi:hypothetical protein